MLERRVRVVIAATVVSCLLGDVSRSVSAQSTNTELGRVQVGGFSIRARLDRFPAHLGVQLGVDHSLDSPIPSDDFQAWLLLKDGNSLTPLRRSPEKGKKPMGWRGGGEYHILVFDFPLGNPVAVVLAVGDQFQVIPLAGKMPR